jgi:amino acid transporter
MSKKTAFIALISSIAWVMTLMLAPHTLSLLGNLAGETGVLLPMGLIMAVGMYLLNAVSYNRLLGSGDFTRSEITVYRQAFGALPAILIGLSGRVVTAVTAATLLLVTSGFIFNEVFAYWFPNFAFAFILLAGLVLIHFVNHRAPQIFQILFIGAAFSGLVVLVCIGLAAPEVAIGDNELPQIALKTRPALLILWLFLGVELVYICQQDQKTAPENMFNATILGLVAAAILFGLWGLVSIKFVALERLSDSTIAHVLVAKKVWGQAGRYLIGAVVISGTCAAVNGLFMAVSQMIKDLSNQRLKQSHSGLVAKRPALTVLALGITTAAMMAGGMAGTEEIDIYLRAGLLLWMLNYVAMHVAVMILDGQHRIKRLILPGIGALTMLGTTIMLIFTDPDQGILLRFMAGAVLVLAALVGGGLWYQHWKLRIRK